MQKRENVVVEKSIEFSLLIVTFCEKLEKEIKFIIAKQLLKSGTSIGANIHEAQNAESRADFIHKIKIAAKELKETKYWLIICERSENYPFDSILKEKIKYVKKIIDKLLN